MAAEIGNKYAEGNEGGRPPLYKEEYAGQAYKLCLLGATDAEMADFFNVTEQTINNWKNEYQEFFESIMRGKVIADAEVAESLYKRACGFEYQEKHYEKIELKEGNVDEEDIRIEAYKKKVIVKQVVPDTQAASLWLRNRRPKSWRDKTEVEQSGSVKIAYSDMTDEQIENELRRLEAFEQSKAASEKEG